MKIVLASSSSNRQRALRNLGFEFEVVTPNVDEKAIRSTDPITLVRELARAKSAAARSLLTEPAIMIAADQIVYFNGEIREKPVDEAEARRFLESYRGSTLHIVNGLCVVNTATNQQVEGIEVTTARFNNFPTSVIDELLIEGRVLIAAGSLMVQNPRMQPYIDWLDGTFESCMGIPEQLTRRLIDAVQS